MKIITTTMLAIVLTAGAASAQAQDDVTKQLPEGAMMPSNLSDLGHQMKNRVTEIVTGDAEEGPGGARTQDGLSLFSGGEGEDPRILEIKKIASDLDTQRALMNQISALQKDLIDFAMTDPAAAHKSRIPASVCEYALESRFCEAMDASFQPRKIISVEK